MKSIILLTIFLLSGFLGQAQETVSYVNGNQTIKFSISTKESYVECTPKQRTVLEQLDADAVTWLTAESALVAKHALTSQMKENLQRVEPVLIYKDGVKQMATGQLNIQLQPNSTIAVLAEIFEGQSFTFEKSQFTENLYLVKTELEQAALFTLINQLQGHQQIDFVEPNFTRLLNTHTNDPFYNSQWSINNTGTLAGTPANANVLSDADMDVDNAWPFVNKGSGIKVAVVDVGVELTHPDLVNNLLPGYDAYSPVASSTNGGHTGNDNHGTACAGIIAAEANNNIGIAGIAYQAKILPIRIGPSGPNGTILTDGFKIANAFNWAWQNGGADIISNSWGGGSPASTITTAINDAVNNGRGGSGCVVLFSVGNLNNVIEFPSTVPSTIAVGATSFCDVRKSPSNPNNPISFISCGDGETWGSNYGSGLDVVAPGVRIYTTDLTGTSGSASGDYMSDFNGTSAACPNVAGVAALILSSHPWLTQAEVRAFIEGNTDQLSGYSYNPTTGQPNGNWDTSTGYGRVNAFKAAQAASQANTTIVGFDDFVCDGAQNQFIVVGGSSPTGIDDYNWTVSSNLEFVGRTPSYQGYAVVNPANGTGQGLGTISISTWSGTVNTDVWAGLPLDVSGITFSPTFNCIPTNIYTITAPVPNNLVNGTEEYEWTVTNGVINTPGGNVTTFTGGNMITFDPNNAASNFSISVIARNRCGTSTPFVRTFNCFNTPVGEVIAKPAVTSIRPAAAAICFPNPSKGTVSVNTALLRTDKNASTIHLRILDVNGQVVVAQQANQIVEELSLHQLSAGIYIVQLLSDQETITEKLVVQ